MPESKKRYKIVFYTGRSATCFVDAYSEKEAYEIAEDAMDSKDPRFLFEDYVSFTKDDVMEAHEAEIDEGRLLDLQKYVQEAFVIRKTEANP